MADEKPTESEDIVSLEDLMRDDAAEAASPATVAGAPVPAPASPSEAEPAPETAPAADPAAEAASAATTSADLDNLLASADPEFAAQLKDLAELGADGSADDSGDIDSLVARAREESASRGWRKLVLLFVKRPLRRMALEFERLKEFARWLKTSGVPMAIAGSKTGAGYLKRGLLAVLGFIKGQLGAFRALPLKSKLLLMTAVMLGSAAIVAAKITLKGRVLPSFEVGYLTSFAAVADHSWTFSPEESWDDLNDPLLHPEHVVLIERIVANLRTPGDGSNPMAMIDLYVESASQDVAIELKNRDAEARDMIGRTLGAMTYDELITQAGKTKLKVFLRKNFNEILTTGRVRRVYFRNIIVKP